MLLETILIPVSNLMTNSGQIEGLPANPRLIKDGKFRSLMQSIKDDPDMLSIRELIVYPFKKSFVVIGGNMRLKACIELGYKEVPCKVLNPKVSVDTLKAILMKDNISYGDTDWDMVANDWNTDDLEYWGMDIPKDWNINQDEYGEDFSLASGDRKPFQQMTFTLADQQAEQIKNAIAEMKQTEEYRYAETMGNENSNGNALYLIIMQWAELKK